MLLHLEKFILRIADATGGNLKTINLLRQNQQIGYSTLLVDNHFRQTIQVLLPLLEK